MTAFDEEWAMRDLVIGVGNSTKDLALVGTNDVERMNCRDLKNCMLPMFPDVTDVECMTSSEALAASEDRSTVSCDDENEMMAIIDEECTIRDNVLGVVDTVESFDVIDIYHVKKMGCGQLKTWMNSISMDITDVECMVFNEVATESNDEDLACMQIDGTEEVSTADPEESLNPMYLHDKEMESDMESISDFDSVFGDDQDVDEYDLATEEVEDDDHDLTAEEVENDNDYNLATEEVEDDDDYDLATEEPEEGLVAINVKQGYPFTMHVEDIQQMGHEELDLWLGPMFDGKQPGETPLPSDYDDSQVSDDDDLILGDTEEIPIVIDDDN